MLSPFKGSTQAINTGDTLALIDSFTGENALFIKVADTTGITADGVIYCKKGKAIYKRALVDGIINPEWYGLAGDGVTDNGTKAVDMVNKIKRYGGGYTLLFPAGKTFICNTPFQIPGSNFTLAGANKWTSIIKNNQKVADQLPIIGFGNIADITVRNIRFEGLDNSRTALAGRAATNFTVDGCTSNCPLFGCTSVTAGYSNNTSATINHNIKLTNNIVTGTGNISMPGCGLYLGFVDGAIVNNNKISHFNQGIQWWGGDAGIPTEGVSPALKWVSNISVSDNEVNDIYGGGIWGSNGDHIAITTNEVWDCYDVGIDVEGCRNAAITSNKVRYCTHGGITTFYACSAVNITGNTVIDSTPNRYLFEIYNAYQSFDNKNISVTGNTFNHTGSGFGRIGGDNAQDFLVSVNNFTNVKIDANANNFKNIEIKNNSFKFYNAVNDSGAVINVGGYHTNGRVHISNNTVTSSVRQPRGVMAIYVEDGDFNTSNKAWIEGNVINGFNRDIVVNAITDNTNIYPEFYVENNVLGNAHFERLEKLGHSKVILSNNRDSAGQPFPAAIPTGGKWDEGQTITYALPDTFGNAGAVCLVTGAPGIWKGQGNKLIEFSGHIRDNITHLFWKTISGMTTKQFLVQRSSNSVGFNTIDSVEALPVSGNHSYYLDDKKLLTSHYFYRLRMRDNDGRMSYSNIISVKSGKENVLMSVYPNPAKNNAAVLFNAVSQIKYALTITDLSGKAIENIEGVSESGENKIFLNLHNLNPGTYFIILTDTKNNRSSIKLDHL